MGLFIAAILGPPLVNGAGHYIEHHGAPRAGRVVSAVLPTLVRCYTVWAAFRNASELHKRLCDIERAVSLSRGSGADGAQRR